MKILSELYLCWLWMLGNWRRWRKLTHVHLGMMGFVRAEELKEMME